MPYSFSQVSGRLSQQGVPKPAGLGAAVATAEIIYPHGSKFAAVHEPTLSANYRPLPENYGQVLEKMRVFQVDNKLPIHLKGGPRDMMFFGATLAVCAVGLAGCFKFYYDMSFPQKAE